MVFRVIMNQNFVMIFIILIFLIHILPEIKKVQFQPSDRKYTRMYWKKKKMKEEVKEITKVPNLSYVFV